MENEITHFEENLFYKEQKIETKKKRDEKKTQAITYRKVMNNTWGKLILFTASLLEDARNI